jgi:hypothetical protein
LPNLKNIGTIYESRSKHIYSPTYSSYFIEQNKFSVVFPVLNKIIKINYELQYPIFVIEPTEFNYIGTIFMLYLRIYQPGNKNSSIFLSRHKYLHITLTNNFEKLYDYSSYKSYVLNRLLEIYCSNNGNLTIKNLFNDNIYFQTNHKYWKSVINHYRTFFIYRVLI